MKPSSRLFTSRRISLAAASFLSLASLAAAAVPYADTNPFERSSFGNEWSILSNDIFFGGAEALFGLSPASRTLLLFSASDSKTTSASAAIVTEESKEDLFSFALALESPFVRSSGGGFTPNAVVVPDNRLWIGTGSSNGWLNSANWSPADQPDTVTEVAQFGAASNTANTVITTGTGTLNTGAVEMLSNRTANMTIASGATAGGTRTLSLAGVTINGVDETILRNNSAFNLLFRPNNGQATPTTLQIALGNATNNVVNINSTGNIDIGVAITGSGRNLTLNGTSTGDLIFSGGAANTYNGLTTVNSGTLILNKTAGVNAIAGNVKIGNGTAGGTATVELAASNQIANSSDMELAGGTLRLNGVSEGTTGAAGLGSLTLTSNSIINLAGTNILHFDASALEAWTPGAILSIYNWNGTPITGGGPEQILFGGTVPGDGLNALQLASIQFYSGEGTGAYAPGAILLANGEIVPVPEPSTWIGAALALAAIGFTQRRKLRALIATRA